jgi:hypothetical protein
VSTSTNLRTVITEGASIVMVYRRADGDIQERRVDVERIWTTASGATAFMGYCHTRQERRTFTLDHRHVLWVAPAETVTIERFGPDPLRTPDALAEKGFAVYSQYCHMQTLSQWLPMLEMPGLVCAAVA